MTLEKIVIIGNQVELHKSIRPLTNQLFSADDIEEAHAIINRAEPDLVICDNSIENNLVSHFLKQTNKQPNTPPVVILTQDTQHYSLYKKAGAIDCICPEK